MVQHKITKIHGLLTKLKPERMAKEKVKDKTVRTVKTLFIPDTNVVLHDHTCIYKFEEHDVRLLTTMLEELDTFKKGQDTKGFNVREFHRILDELAKVTIKRLIKVQKGSVEKDVSALFNGGVSLRDDLGKIDIYPVKRKLHEAVRNLYFDETPDHRILSAVYEIQKAEEGKRRVVLVTKDINLRLKAKSLGIEVEDYENDKVPDLKKLDVGWEEIQDERLEPLVDMLYKDNKISLAGTDYAACFDAEKMMPNKYLLLRSNEKHSVLAQMGPEQEYVRKVMKQSVSGISPRNMEQTFLLDAFLQAHIKLVLAMGPAGTGKTLLAMAAAIHLLKEGRQGFDKIIISAAMMTVGNKEFGALPGTAKEKVIPFMGGLFDNLDLIKSQLKTTPKTQEEDGSKKDKKQKKVAPPEKSTEDDYIVIFQKEGQLEIQALALLRGRSLNNTILIVDEAQNLTPHEVKTIITRAGFNTKIFVCGDVYQIDTPYLDALSNGLSKAIYSLTGNKIVAHVILVKGERSELATLASELM